MALFTNFKNNKKNMEHHKSIKNDQKKNYVNYISHDNKILKNPLEIAEAFNDYYINVAPNLDKNIPPSNENP